MSTTTTQFCTFSLGEFLFGIAVESVQEIIRFQPTTPVPLAPAMVHGLINLRGQIVTAIDLRRRLEMPARPEDTLPTNVIVRTGDGAVSLLVDEIGDVVEIDPVTFELPPETLAGAARGLVSGVYKLDGHLLLALDVARTIQAGAALGETVS